MFQWAHMDVHASSHVWLLYNSNSNLKTINLRSLCLKNKPSIYRTLWVRQFSFICFKNLLSQLIFFGFFLGGGGGIDVIIMLIFHLGWISWKKNSVEQGRSTRHSIWNRRNSQYSESTNCIWTNKWYSSNIFIITNCINSVLQKRATKMKTIRTRLKVVFLLARLFSDLKWLLASNRKILKRSWTMQSIHWCHGRYSGHHWANQPPSPTLQESLRPLKREKERNEAENSKLGTTSK